MSSTYICQRGGGAGGRDRRKVTRYDLRHLLNLEEHLLDTLPRLSAPSNQDPWLS